MTAVGGQTLDQPTVHMCFPIYLCSFSSGTKANGHKKVSLYGKSREMTYVPTFAIVASLICIEAMHTYPQI